MTIAPGALQFPTSMQIQPAVGTVPALGSTNLAPVPFNITTACGPGLNNAGAGEPNNNPNVNCDPNILPDEFILRNGAFKAQGLRNVRYTGPHFHNGSKMNLRQVFDFYKNIGDLTPGVAAGFPNLNLANLDAGLRIIGLDPARESAVIEMMETGLTDWASVYEEGKFSHPQLCVAVGHDPETGESIMADLHARARMPVGRQAVTSARLADLRGRPAPRSSGTARARLQRALPDAGCRDRRSLRHRRSAAVRTGLSSPAPGRRTPNTGPRGRRRPRGSLFPPGALDSPAPRC